MAGDSKKLNREEAVAKVLQINPNMQIGDMTPEQMSEHLLQTVRKSRRPPKFSDEKFVAVFSAMLADLEQSVENELVPLLTRRQELDEDLAELRRTITHRVAGFVAGAFPGDISEATRNTLRQHAPLLSNLRTSISEIGQLVRSKSAKA